MADDDNILCQKLYWWYFTVKFIYSEKATKFCEISTLLLSYVAPIKSKVEISQNFVAFSEYVNFTDDISRVLSLVSRVLPILSAHS